MLQANVVNTPPKNNIKESGSSPRDIVKRLAELSQWQEEQKKQLQEKQSVQRQRLGIEQMTMYEMLGLRKCDELPVRLHSFDTDELSPSAGEKDDPPTPLVVRQVARQVTRHVARQVARGQPIHTAIQEVTMTSDEEEDGADEYGNKVLFSPPTLAPKNTDITVPMLDGGNLQQTKRPFLKRGEGLKQRFKIDPDALRLHNLPNYKYAKAHAKLNANPKPRPAPIKKQKIATSARKDASLDVHEQRFQQLLFSARNVCNSTPDAKFTISGTELNAVKPVGMAVDAPIRVRFSDGNTSNKQQSKVTDEAVDQSSSHQCSVNSSNSCSSLPIAWSKVLDSQLIRPLSVHQFRTSTEQSKSEENERENLSIFELLEQKASEGTIDMNSSCIQRLMQQRAKTEETADADEIHVDERLRETGLRPAVSEVLNESSSSTSYSSDRGCDEANESDALMVESGNEDGANANGNDKEHALDMEKVVVNGYSGDAAPAQSNCQRQEIHVRFDDTGDTCEDLHSSSSETTLAGNETNHNQVLFDQFKEALFAALQSNVENDLNNVNTTNIDQLTDLSPSLLAPAELQNKTQLIKQRLVELESEISTFKVSNQELLKARQAHELEVALFENERFELKEQLKDERIQMEMYLHDERMKIEEDYRRMEQQLRKDAAQSKERKEIARLKQELQMAQGQLRQKEQSHAAAQARLRVQIRNFERDQRLHIEEIERLGKVNKCLQSEMTQRERESNKKMLQEINRNIAKLAPKLSFGPPANTGEPVQRGVGASRRSLTAAPQSSTSRGHSRRCVRTPPTPPSSHRGPPPQKTPPKNVRRSTRSLISTPAKEAGARRPIAGSQSLRTRRHSVGESQQQRRTDSDIDDHVSYKESRNDDDDDDDCGDDDDEENAEIASVMSNFEANRAAASNIDVCSMHTPKRFSTTGPILGNCKTPPRSPPSVRSNAARKSKTSADLTAGAGDSNNNNNKDHNSKNSDSHHRLHVEFKREIINDDGSRDIWYPNGNLKKIAADGMVIRMLYFNKDIKETNITEGTVRYYYAESNTWQTTYLDGLEILEFPNGQTEHRQKNGIIETHFPNNSIKIVNPADEYKEEEWKFADGSTMVKMRNGDKLLMLPNGQKEIHTKLHKRREYPDGTLKTVYPDGSQETRYSNGRVRLRDVNGALLMDTIDIK